MQLVLGVKFDRCFIHVFPWPHIYFEGRNVFPWTRGNQATRGKIQVLCQQYFSIRVKAQVDHGKRSEKDPAGQLTDRGRSERVATNGN